MSIASMTLIRVDLDHAIFAVHYVDERRRAVGFTATRRCVRTSLLVVEKSEVVLGWRQGLFQPMRQVPYRPFPGLRLPIREAGGQTSSDAAVGTELLESAAASWSGW